MRIKTFWRVSLAVTLLTIVVLVSHEIHFIAKRWLPYQCSRELESDLGKKCCSKILKPLQTESFKKPKYPCLKPNALSNYRPVRIFP